MESLFHYLKVLVGGNEMDRREHSFLSITSKPQFYIPPKLREIKGNGMGFNEIFTTTIKNSALILKQGSISNIVIK